MEYLYTILCDDVRREMGGRVSLIGLYGNKLTFKQLPHTMRDLHFYQRWILDEGVYEANVELWSPSGKNMISEDVQKHFEEGLVNIEKGDAILQLVVVGSDVRFDEAGFHSFKTTLKKGQQEISGVYKFEVNEK